MRVGLVVAIAVLAAGAGLLGGFFLPRSGEAADTDPGAVAGTFRFRNPLLDAAPAEWAIYRLIDGKKMRIEVMKVDPSSRAVTLLEERRDPVADALLGSEVRPINPNHFFLAFDSAGAVVTSVWTEDVEVGGKMIRCLAIETIGHLAGLVRHFYSPEIPALGLVRQVSVREGSSSPSAELLDWSGRR
ncbi:MAG: hypothetical protein MUE73_09255 [Planctomycetes bacterium]|jgi:hypothetical protein|nr:hypothetical protein [Planctomycetota bacterium]